MKIKKVNELVSSGLFKESKYLDELWNAFNLTYELYDDGYLDDELNFKSEPDKNDLSYGLGADQLKEIVSATKEYIFCLYNEGHLND